MSLSHPPSILDNANVLYWAWSGERPFGVLPDGLGGIAVYGFAICRYAESGQTYRFTCDQSWNVEQDEPCGPVDDPYRVPLPGQYDTRGIVWMGFHVSGSTVIPRPPLLIGEWLSSAIQKFAGWA